MKRSTTYYKSEPETQEMSLHISLGVNRDLSAEPRALTLLLDEPARIADITTDRLDIEFFGFEPSFAPQGKRRDQGAGQIGVPLLESPKRKQGVLPGCKRRDHC